MSLGTLIQLTNSLQITIKWDAKIKIIMKPKQQNVIFTSKEMKNTLHINSINVCFKCISVFPYKKY